MPSVLEILSGDSSVRRTPAPALSATEFQIAGVSLVVETDDAAFTAEFTRLFGGPANDGGAPVARLRATVAAGADAGRGHIEIEGDALADGPAFLLQFASQTVPFVELPATSGESWIGIEGIEQPLFIFQGSTCSFLKGARWRRIVAHFLFLRALRLRSDLLFFHAASVRIGDRGILLVGPKGTGKTTLSLAIAGAGHDLLGDETAAFEPATGLLLPMRRPASIKPGIRSRLVDERLTAAAEVADEDGVMHVAPSRLFGESMPQTAPLRAVVFLEGFAAAPRIDAVTAGRDELASMQPLRCSGLLDAPSRNVLAMIRLLNGVRCYRLRAGDPDATANLMIEVLGRDDYAHSA